MSIHRTTNPMSLSHLGVLTKVLALIPLIQRPCPGFSRRLVYLHNFFLIRWTHRITFFPHRSTGAPNPLITSVTRRWTPISLSSLLWEILPGTATTEVGDFSTCSASGHSLTRFTDFFNGWQPGVLQKVVDNCHCNPFGDVRRLLFLSSWDIFLTPSSLDQPTCCANQGIFTINKDTNCKITKAWDEQSTF